MMRDIGGNPVPKRGGGFWDHYKEVTEAVNGLRKQVAKLERELANNPSLSATARSQMQQSVDTARSYISRVESIIRSH